MRDPQRQRELEATLDAIDEAIMTVDRDFCVVGFNRAAELLTGYTRDEAIGGRCFEVCAGRFCRHSCDIEAMFATGVTPPDFDTVVQGKDGRVCVVRVRTIPFRNRRGRILAAIRILKDVTGMVPMVQTAEMAHAPLIGEGPAMQQVLRTVDLLRDSEAPVLISGPPGTEKERLARALHASSLRAGGPFVPLQVHGLETSTARGEMERALPLARAGTLYVHDFLHLPEEVRADLVQAVADTACSGRCYERVSGAGEPHERDPRDAGHCDPHRLPPRLIAGVDAGPIQAGAPGVPVPPWPSTPGWQVIELPPLSRRREDIPLLVDHLLQRLRVETGTKVDGLTAGALRALMTYPFPENVEELERILRYALAFRRATWAVRLRQGRAHARDQENLLDVKDLPPEVQRLATPAAHPFAPATLPALVSEGARRGSSDPIAREELLEALEATGWHLTRTAARLGIDRTTLWRRMKRLGIHRPSGQD